MKLEAVEHFYCVNLDKRPDRWSDTLVELEKLGLQDKVERYAAVDGSTLKLLSSLNNGEKGLIATMEYLIAGAIADEYKNILVFEDDIEFVNDYQNIDEYLADVPDDWDMIYLGGNNVQPPKPVTNRVGEIVHTYTTHAIIINARIFHDLLRLMNTQTNKQLDVIYTTSGFKNYIVTPSLVTQRVGFSDIQNRTVNYKNWIK